MQGKDPFISIKASQNWCCLVKESLEIGLISLEGISGTLGSAFG
jgi:hypothetical protein